MDWWHYIVPHLGPATWQHATWREEEIDRLKPAILLTPHTLYHKSVDCISQQAVRQFQKDKILHEAHYGITRGHYAVDATTRKVWESGLWWPTMPKDAGKFFQQFDLCQQLGQPTEQARMPHQPILPCYPVLWVNTFDSPTGIGIKECGAWRPFSRKRSEVEQGSEMEHRC